MACTHFLRKLLMCGQQQTKQVRIRVCEDRQGIGGIGRCVGWTDLSGCGQLEMGLEERTRRRRKRAQGGELAAKCGNGRWERALIGGGDAAGRRGTSTRVASGGATSRPLFVRVRGVTRWVLTRAAFGCRCPLPSSVFPRLSFFFFLQIFKLRASHPRMATASAAWSSTERHQNPPTASGASIPAD